MNKWTNMTEAQKHARIDYRHPWYGYLDCFTADGEPAKDVAWYDCLTHEAMQYRRNDQGGLEVDESGKEFIFTRLYGAFVQPHAGYRIAWSLFLNDLLLFDCIDGDYQRVADRLTRHIPRSDEQAGADILSIHTERDIRLRGFYASGRE